MTSFFFEKSKRFWSVRRQEFLMYYYSASLHGWHQYETEVIKSLLWDWSAYSIDIQRNCITLIVPFSMQSIFLSDASAVFPDVITAHLASLRLAGLHCSFGRHVNGCWAGQHTCVKPLFWLVVTNLPWKGTDLWFIKLPAVASCSVSTPGGGGGTPIHYLYGCVPPNGVVILKLLI